MHTDHGPWRMVRDHGDDKDYTCCECGAHVNCGRLPGSWGHAATCRHAEPAQQVKALREAAITLLDSASLSERGLRLVSDDSLKALRKALHMEWKENG